MVYSFFLDSVQLPNSTPRNEPVYPIDLFFYALFWTQGVMFFMFSGWFFIQTIVLWHGDPKRMLLLRLSEAQENQASPKANLPGKNP